MVEEDRELHQPKGKLDDADMTYLRCLMRKYGWERYDHAVEVCMGSECFRSQRYTKGVCVEFAWFLLQELLHARTTSALQALRTWRAPTTVRELRESRTVCALYIRRHVLV